MKRKILYSPGYGAGWTSWNNYPPELAQFLLTYQPIIDFLEADKPVKSKEFRDILDELDKLVEERFPEASLYTGGAYTLEVAEVEGRVRIDEYDGNETYIEEGKDTGWM